jgi:hypothetical protein
MTESPEATTAVLRPMAHGRRLARMRIPLLDAQAVRVLVWAVSDRAHISGE